MADIEIKRGYEVLPDNNVRFGIRVINNSDSAISDVEVILDYTESLFEIEGDKIQKLGNIPPTVPRTAKFILKPLGCIHKEEIGATVRYKDHQWKKHVEQMRPKEVHCVCPFLKEKSITRADFLRLSNSGSLEERGVNFDGITIDKLVDFIGHTCKNRLYKVDEFPIENGKILYLAGDALGEKAYYLLTVVVKEYEGLAQVLLRASSDKSYGLNGFLNEILDNLRHLVVSASAREIGVIKKEQVINIIDSVVQRSTISMEEGEPAVKIKDSMVQRTEIKGDEERKRREQERLREEREEQERLRRQREEEARLRRGREEQEERAQRERKAQEEAERREREKARQEEERQRRQREEQERIAREKEESRAKHKELAGEYRAEADSLKDQIAEKELLEEVGLKAEEEREIAKEVPVEGTSYKKFLTVALVLGMLLLGYWALATNSNNQNITDEINIGGKYNAKVVYHEIKTQNGSYTIAEIHYFIGTKQFRGGYFPDQWLPFKDTSLDWIKANTPENSIFLNWWDYGDTLRGITGRDVIVASPSRELAKTISFVGSGIMDEKTYGEIYGYEESEKIKDVALALTTDDIDITNNIMDKYNVKYIYITMYDLDIISVMRQDEQYYTKIQTSQGEQIIPTMKFYNSTLAKLLLFNGKDLKHYRMVYESKPNLNWDKEKWYKNVYNVLYGGNIPLEDTGYIKIFEYNKNSN